jgi:trans-2,3-dihydro-3-hydroxyanthranilate isomerase
VDLAFEIWDVFSRERLLGNPLAVFPDATAVPDEQMGAIAREMAHSETTFVIPRAASVEQEKGVRVRIFSKAGTEMPFAGHPTLGTAFALWTKRQTRTDVEGHSIVLAENIGPIPVRFFDRDGIWEGEMLQTDPVFAETHAASVMAPLLGLTAGDIDAALPLENISTGRPNVVVMLRSRDAMRRVSVNWREVDSYFASGDRERGVYLLTHDGGRWFARKPTRSGDDPVTGSAGGCAAAYLVKHGLAESGARVVLHQGFEVKRQGAMLVSARLEGKRVTGVMVGGSAVLSARGVLTI